MDQDKDPQSLETLFRRARELDSAGRWDDEALMVNTRIAKVAGNPSNAYARLAKCYLARGDLASAEAMCQKARATVPLSRTAERHCAEVQAAVTAHRRRGRIRIQQAIPCMSASEAFALGMDARRKGEADLAVLALARAVEANPAASHVVALAAAYRQAGQPRRAEALYRQVLTGGPNKAAVVGLAAVLKDRGALGEARRLLEDADKRNPNDAYVLNTMGAVLCGMGRLRDAEDCFERVSRLGSPRRDNLSELRDAYIQRGDHAGAARIDSLMQLL